MVRFNFKWRLFVLSLLIFHLRSSSQLLATDQFKEATDATVKKSYIKFQTIDQSSFDVLPNEIITHHITPFLQAPDIFALWRSCKELYAMMKDSNPVWKRLYICCKAKGSLKFENAVSNWKVLYHITLTLQQQTKELSFALESRESLLKTTLLTNHPFASYIKGIHAEMQERINENKDIQSNSYNTSAFKYYQEASDGGNMAARQRLTLAIYQGELGLGTRSIEDRRAMLEQRALQGDHYAQELIDEAHFGNSPLKYHEKPQANYFEKLMKRTEKRDNDAFQARRWLTQAINSRVFEYAKMSDSERSQRLRSLAEQGDAYVHFWNLQTLYSREEKATEQERFNILSKGASENDNVAQSLFYKAIYEGTLAQDKVSKEERFKKLLDEAGKGQRVAQDYVNHAYYYGSLSQQDVSKEKRFEALLKREQQGDRDAQIYITKAYYEGALDCHKLSIDQRFKILLERAAKGDYLAQDFTMYTFKNGAEGQRTRIKNVLVLDYSFKLLNELIGNIR